MAEMCNEDNEFGNCHVSEIIPVGNDQGTPLTACVSRVSELRARAAAGMLSCMWFLDIPRPVARCWKQQYLVVACEVYKHAAFRGLLCCACDTWL